VYTFGTTATIDFSYYAPGVQDPTLGAYRLIFTDAVTGAHDSGIKLWGAAEPDGCKGYNSGTEVALHFQGFNNLVQADGIDITYGNVSVTPAPGALALLGLGGLVASRRRR
jgi:MYXO-CTERM domain-containing protein